MTFTLVQTDERLDIREDNALIGYVDNDILFGINSAGYAEEIGNISHRSEIKGKLHEWNEGNKGKGLL